jgi:hypothetical protein
MIDDVAQPWVDDRLRDMATLQVGALSVRVQWSVEDKGYRSLVFGHRLRLKFPDVKSAKVYAMSIAHEELARSLRELAEAMSRKE